MGVPPKGCIVKEVVVRWRREGSTEDDGDEIRERVGAVGRLYNGRGKREETGLAELDLRFPSIKVI